ncbi:MAG: hypothetical protein IIZ94_06605, partial [Prevotella sp.]|nr:hypothetical protein [Prevotella sp.]
FVPLPCLQWINTMFTECKHHIYGTQTPYLRNANTIFTGTQNLQMVTEVTVTSNNKIPST